MEQKIFQIQRDFLDKISKAQSLAELDKIFLDLFGKKGQVTLLPKDFHKLPKETLVKVGPIFNNVKTALEQTIEKRRQEVREEGYQKLTKEKLDLKIQIQVKKREGHLHPLTSFEKEIADLFGKLGFQQYDAPHIDTDYNNFEVLNIPPDHPARDLQDTLYINSSNIGPQPGKLLLRTHTSNSQIRILKEFKSPIRMMNIGRCFRYENLDARHEHTFDQFEIIYVDEKVSMANLQYLSEYFLKSILGDDVVARLSPGYYPFTEPSAHIFGTCVFCKGEGCSICGQTGELELAGAGMIHPQVLRNCGIDPQIYSGIAWGVGPGRMAMLKYNIDDLRLFNSGDLKFLTGLGKDKR